MISNRVSRFVLLSALLVVPDFFCFAFLPQKTAQSCRCELKLQSASTNTCKVAASAFLAATLAFGAPVFADEIGVEKDAPTLFTGETVMICTKRGPLGACTKSEVRTVENDNDKANKYFRDPADIIRAKQEALKKMEEETEGNALIDRLRQQSVDNQERNRLSVELKTFENDQGANFGPFNGQTVIQNTDGKTFTLLENPQAMRLKKQGFIEGRKFVKQPTEADIEAALEPDADGGLAGAILGALGKGPD